MISLLAVVRTAFPPERFTVSPAVVVNAPDEFCVIAEPDVSPLVRFIDVADIVPSNVISPEAFIVADPESVVLLLCVYELIPERFIDPRFVAVPVVVTAPAEVTVRLFPALNVPSCRALIPLFI